VTLRQKILTALLLGVTAACAAGPAPSDHFYRLEAGPPGTSFDPPPLTGTLEVRRFRADAVTAERRMVLREDGESAELQRHAYHYWSDAPTTILQVELADYLREANIADQVVTSEARLKGNYVLTGRIRRLERVVGNGRPRVDVSVEFALLRESDRNLLVLETYREELPVRSSEVGDAATAFGQALTRIFARFVRDAAR
jgi:ABC-type uncharacterized transport system auxiliary subunit